MFPETLHVYVLGAVAYSLATYASKRTKPEGEPLAPKKLVRAVVVGLIVGVVAASQGIELTLTNFPDVAAASGAVVIADQVVKGLWRAGSRRFNRA